MQNIFRRLMLGSATVALAVTMSPVLASADTIIGDGITETRDNNGATDTFQGQLILGNNGGSGTYTIEGAGAEADVTFNPGGNGGNPNGALIVGNDDGSSGAVIQGADTSDTLTGINVAGDMSLGQQQGSVGTFTLNAGTLTVGGQLAVGGQSTGDNEFFQNGGTLNLPNTASSDTTDYVSIGPNAQPFGGALVVGGGVGNGDGSNSGGTGTYTMTGGIINATNVIVGGSGTGVMTQSDGTTINTSFLQLGFDSGSNGTYTMTGGAINAQSESVGFAGVGAFSQSGGTNSMSGQLAVGVNTAPNGQSLGPNTYTLTGGELDTGNTVIGAGEDGSMVVNDTAGGSTVHNVTGNLIIAAQGDAVQPPLSSPPAPPVLPNTGNGDYSISGNNASLNVGFVGSAGDPPPSSGPNGAVIVGDYGTATFTQGLTDKSDLNNQVIVAGDLVLGNHSGSQGTYTLNEGDLTVGGVMTIGSQSNNDNEFIQNGGLVKLTGTAGGDSRYAGVNSNPVPSLFTGNLQVGGDSVFDSGAGSYTMNKDAVLQGGSVYVGYSGTGHFTMNDNSSINVGYVDLGFCGGCNGGNSAGFFAVHDNADVVTNAMNIGDVGHGEFVQDGESSVTVDGLLVIANAANPTPNVANPGNFDRTGTYTLSGDATLSTQNTVVGAQGTGTFNQNGGDHEVADTLTIGQQTLGTNNGAGTPQDPIFGGPAIGTYNMTAGTLNVTNDIILGGAAANQSNFTSNPTPKNPVDLDVSGGNGTFKQTGGTITAGRNEIVGLDGVGNFNESGAASTNTVTGELALGVNDGSNGTYVLADGSVSADTISVGGSQALQTTINGGTGHFIQNSGTVTANTLGIGQFGGTGEYDLNAGTLTVNDITYVSGNSTGTFDQTGVSSFTTGFLNVGIEAGGAGTFLLGSSNATVHVQDDLGVGGPVAGGSFQQTAGTVQVDGDLFVSNDSSKTTQGGQYNISAGSLTVNGNAYIGNASLGVAGGNGGVFTQTGGTATFGSDLIIGSQNGDNGSYALSGASTVTADVDLALIVGDAAGSNGLVTLTGGTLTSGASAGGQYDIVVGNHGTGEIDNSGGAQVSEGELGLILGYQKGGNGTYKLSGTGSLSGPQEVVGYFGTGTFIQSGNSTNTTDYLVVGGEYGGPASSYSLSGGSLKVSLEEQIGAGTIGSFTQTGGSNSAGSLIVGDQWNGLSLAGTGTYTLGGTGDLSVTGDITLGSEAHTKGTFNFNTTVGDSATISNLGGALVVGDAGTGIFNQADGTITAKGGLDVGRSAGGVGTYNQTGGTLNDDATIGDAGTGTYNNTGATHNVTGDLNLGAQSTGNGTYNLTAGGKLTVTDAAGDGFTFVGASGTGTFLNDNSTHTTDNLVIAQGTGSTGTYTLQDNGVLNVGTGAATGFMAVGEHGNGAYNQTGGTATIDGSLDVGRYSALGSKGYVKLSGGTVTVNGFTVVGDQGTGTIEQNGGTFTTGDLNVGRQNGTGTYYLYGTGSLKVGGNLLIGGETGFGGTGTFNYNNLGGVSTGSLSFTGSNQSLVVGVTGTGSFIEGNGTKPVDLNLQTSGTTLDIAQQASSKGTYSMGTGATLEAGPVIVGDGGSQGGFFNSGGSVTIGTTATNADLTLGKQSTGNGTYQNAGSTTVNGNLVIGDAGFGSLDNVSGTTSVTGSVTLGKSSTGSGGIEIDSGSLSAASLMIDATNKTDASEVILFGGSVQVTGDVIINNSGTANGSELVIRGGASLSAATITNNDIFDFGNGTVTAAVTNNQTLTAGIFLNGSGSTSTLNGSLTNTATGTVGVSGTSSLDVAGPVSNSGQVDVGGGSNLNVTGAGNNYTQTGGTTKVDGTLAAAVVDIQAGLLEGIGTITGNVKNTAGTVKGGDSPGTMTITGNYTQLIAGIFEVDLAGTANVQTSRVNVSGVATLAGNIDVVLLNSFAPALNDRFNVLNFAGGRVGDFNSFTYNGAACTLSSVDLYDCGSGLFFQEDFVGATELDLVVAEAGPPPPPPPPPPPGGVPEPWTVAIFGAGLAGLTSLTRRRKVLRNRA